MVLDAAKRVSIVTAVSPRAMVDLAYVVFEAGRLIRRLAELYGGRPGTLGFFRLARDVLAHLAVTGAIAAGDDLVHQLVGQGLAAQLSAKLGEGVVNGTMTARIGIAAIERYGPCPSPLSGVRSSPISCPRSPPSQSQGPWRGASAAEIHLPLTGLAAPVRSINQSCSWSLNSDEPRMRGNPMKFVTRFAFLVFLPPRDGCRPSTRVGRGPGSQVLQVGRRQLGRPGEIVAGKYKGTRFNCTFDGTTPTRKRA